MKLIEMMEDLRLRGKFWVGLVVIASMLVVAESSLKQGDSTYNHTQNAVSHRAMESQSGYKHVWPEMKFGWRIVVGAIVGFVGSTFGSAGGVGGGGIILPMLNLIIGFDAKTSAAISKCMITAVSISTVYYNLKLRHPTLEMPVIDYELALLFQPMLVLGVSIGVTLNVILADWMVTVLLIIVSLVMSTKACFKGVEIWKKETLAKKESTRCLESKGNDAEEVVINPPPGNISNSTQKGTKDPVKAQVSILENVYWRELGLLVAVWLVSLALQISKNHTTTCSVGFWMLNLAQIPVSVVVTLYQAVSLNKGRRKIESRGGEARRDWQVRKLVLYSLRAVLAGMLAGLVGVGGAAILSSIFLEIGIPPLVSTATATFAVAFSASMSAIEYYLLKRFPVPYALFFFAVAFLAGYLGQHVVKKLIDILGRTSIIIFTFSFVVFVGAISLGGVGIVSMVKRIKRKEYMGFDNICSSAA